MTAQLIIGDYCKSSWSLRAWLVLKTANIAFETVQIALEQPDTKAAILKYSPSGKVPALLQDGLSIPDSLAIAEWAAETHPQCKLWPADNRVRAMARSAAAEMHSGFTNLRTQMSFGLGTGDIAEPLTPQTQWEIERIFQIFRSLRNASGSATFLCGEFGIVDAMFTPVIFRLRRYGVALPADLQTYADAILRYAPVKDWMALANAEA